VTKIYLALDEECASGMADGLSQTRDQGDLREVLGVEVPPDKAAQQLGRLPLVLVPQQCRRYLLYPRLRLAPVDVVS
jgi:hypothetical protein